MATLLPPPKRVKVYHGVPEPEPEPPKPSSNIVVQFVSEEDGQPLAPAVNLPANLSREALEGLLNKLSPQVYSVLCVILQISHLDPRKILCRFHFMSHSQRMKPGFPVHPPG
jgi:hypothetical protein